VTTEAFASQLGALAQAQARAWELATAGQKEGTFPCPRCGSTVKFTALIAHKSSGRCTAAGCIRWSN
jgi:hypothetical protein